jgi:ribosomal protein S18 acetylase RimI-like enzyme
MDQEALLALFDREQRAGMEYHGMKKEALPGIVRFSRPAPGTNFVLYSNLDEGEVDRAIAEQVALFGPTGQPFHWTVMEHDRPANLKERLLAHNFRPQEPDAVMVLDLRNAPAALLARGNADVRRLTGREHLADVIRVEEGVWGANFDWISGRLGDHMAVPGYLSVYVAYAEGRPACAGWIYFHEGSHFAGIWGGSTLPAYRRRGLYTAVLAARVQEAIGRGFRYLTIEASPMSRPIVARHGFELLTYAQEFVWQGGKEG